MSQRGHFLIEGILAAALLSIVAALTVPQALTFWREALIEQEANILAADLRHLQSQSRSNDFRAAGLRDFYEPPAAMTLYVSETGWQMRRSVYDVYYRHNLPSALRLETFRSAAKVTVNFGQNGGSVQNNTFKIYAVSDPALCRYVIISGMGRIRTANAPPTGDY